MGYRNYWELSERERAALTHDDVERFGDAELMAKGVLKVDPLVVDPEPPTPVMQTTQFYRVGELLFATHEQLKTFLDLVPLKVHTQYLNGNYRESVEYAERAFEKRDIRIVELTSEDAFKAHKSALEKRSATVKANADRREKWEKALSEQNEALRGMWSDWHYCRDLDIKHRKLVETYESYTRIAGGDRSIAARFLLKAFKREQINEAAEWCGVTIELPSELEDDGSTPVHEASEPEASEPDAIAF